MAQTIRGFATLSPPAQYLNPNFMPPSDFYVTGILPRAPREPSPTSAFTIRAQRRLPEPAGAICDQAQARPTRAHSSHWPTKNGRSPVVSTSHAFTILTGQGRRIAAIASTVGNRRPDWSSSQMTDQGFQGGMERCKTLCGAASVGPLNCTNWNTSRKRSVSCLLKCLNHLSQGRDTARASPYPRPRPAPDGRRCRTQY